MPIGSDRQAPQAVPIRVLKQEGPIDQRAKPYRPIGAIAEMFKSRDRELVLEGPADTGKSRGCLEKLHLAMMKYPGAQGAIVRKTRQSLTMTAMATYERNVAPAGTYHRWHDQEYRYPNGSKVYLFGLDDPERVKSLEADMIYVQEASELSEEDWEILSTRVTGRGAVMPYVQLLADMNPVNPDFWLYKREQRGNVRFIQVRHEDNPSITPERLAALDTLTGYRYKRLRLGLRVAAEGMFFDEWNPESHLIDDVELEPDWPCWTATDWGFADPFCTLWFARANDPQRTIYVYRERYATQLHEDEQARVIKAAERKGERLVLRVGDPSMFNARTESDRPSLATVYERNGVKLERATNARIAGWNAVRRVLGRPGEAARLKVVRTACPNLVRTLPTMVRDPLDPEDLADKLGKVKTEDHAVDALRYGIMAESAMETSRELARMMQQGLPMTFHAPESPKEKTPQQRAEGKPFYD